MTLIFCGKKVVHFLAYFLHIILADVLVYILQHLIGGVTHELHCIEVRNAQDDEGGCKIMAERMK